MDEIIARPLDTVKEPVTNSNPERGINKRRAEKERIEEATELYTLLAEHKSKYSAQERIEVATEWLIDGNMTKISKSRGVPLETIKDWRDRPWWPLALKGAVKKKDMELDNGFTSTIHKLLTEVNDRVLEGDVVIDKDGSERRVPMKGRDLAATLSLLFDKRNQLRVVAGSETTTTTQSQKMAALESKFKEFASTLQKGAIDVEFEEVIDVNDNS